MHGERSVIWVITTEGLFFFWKCAMMMMMIPLEIVDELTDEWGVPSLASDMTV